MSNFSFIRTDIIMCNFVMSADTVQTFGIWLRSLDQTQMVQDACIEQLRTYLIQICTDIFVLESTGPRSSWIWMALRLGLSHVFVESSIACQFEPRRCL